MQLHARVAVLFLIISSACGLEVRGSGEASGRSPCDRDASTPCIAVPAGWTLTLAGPGGAACPAGFASKGLDVYEGPTLGVGACACTTCQVTAQPSCAGGTVVGHYSFEGACDFGIAPGHANDPAGGCNTDLYPGEITGVELRV